MATPATSASPETRAPRESVQHGANGRGWRWILLVVGVIAILLCAVAMLPEGATSRQIEPQLTHTVSRRDLAVSVTEQGTLESSDNTEIICKVRGQNTVIFVVEGGTIVEPGDVLVRLDTLFIEEQINERTKYAHWSRSASERSKADVARSELAISEYLEGRYKTELMTLEKDFAVGQSRLTTSKNLLAHAELMFEHGYVSELDVEDNRFAVKQAELNVEVKQTQIDVLKRFTKEMELETLRGNLAADKARHEADRERAFADAHRRDRALEEYAHCVIKADRGGLVIYPSAAKWKDAPDIEQGATVHKDQVLLLMPDLSKMQVKVGMHESVIDRVKPGLVARVTLPDRTLLGEVTSVASITSPAGWWTGNVVTYDTVIQLPSVEGLKPGMSAEVEVVLAEYEDVVTVPVAAVVDLGQEYFCWVRNGKQVERRALELGDSNDIFIVVKSGLEAGEQVVLNPLAYVDEAQQQALQPHRTATPSAQPEPSVSSEDTASGSIRSHSAPVAPS